MTLVELFTSIANAIREKKGTTEKIKANDFATEIANLSTEGTNIKITDASYLFNSGARLDNINEILALCENVTSTYYMFSRCSSLTSLDLSNFNTSQVTNMNYMFYYCNKLINLNLSNFDTSNVIDMSDMFEQCQRLTELDLSNFNTSNVTSMSSMFQYCNELTSLDLSNFDMTKVVKLNNIFTNCKNLKNLKSFKNLGKGYTSKTVNYSSYILDLSYCTLLTYESLMDVINNLYDLNLTYDVANGGTLYTQSLKLGATNMAKLTAEEIKIATDKGWTVS